MNEIKEERRKIVEKENHDVVVVEEVDTKSLAEVDVEQCTLDVLSSVEFGDKYAKLLDAIDKLTALKNKVNEKAKELLKEQYLASGETKVENELFNMTYIAEGFRESFDVTKFRKEHPELYEKYIKISKVNDSIRITKKKVKEE